MLGAGNAGDSVIPMGVGEVAVPSQARLNTRCIKQPGSRSILTWLHSNDLTTVIPMFPTRARLIHIHYQPRGR